MSRHDPVRLLPQAAESRGDLRHWCLTAPGHRRSPGPAPPTSHTPRPAARAHIAAGWIPDARAPVAWSIAGRTRPPAAPHAVDGFFHTPSNLVVAHWNADVESTAPP